MPDFTASPRVVGANRADFYDLQTLLQSRPFVGKKGEELVLAIYNYFTSTTDGTYHFWPMDENAGAPKIRNVVHDPVKMLNAYGWMICGQCAAFLFALYRAAGLEARTYGVPGHNLCEVHFDGRWHHLDVDMWTWFRTPDGRIASAVELARDAHALIVRNKNKSNPCNLPDRSLEDYAQMYSTAELAGDELKTNCPPWVTRAHTMDFHLRPGETLIRSQSQQGRFHLPDEWKRTNMQKFSNEWRGHPRERFEPFRSFGNGRWIYEPTLSAPSRDVDTGVWERRGLTQDSAGLLGDGAITFRIQSPYPFCGIPDWSGEKITCSDGVWLHLSGAGNVSVELTDAEGQWQRVFDKSGVFDERIDISMQLSSRYECLVRVTLPAGARLKRFRFEGFIMTAPLTLPRLVEGENPMELRCNDQHGLRTVPWSRIVDFRGSADLRGQFVSLENAELKPYAKTWQQLVATDGKSARATVRFAAPPGRTFAWLYAHATIREAPEGTSGAEALLEWSLNGKDWKPLAKYPISSSRMQWDCSIDGEVTTDAATEIWVRVTAATGVSAMELHGHINVPNAADGGSLKIVHRWEEDGGSRSFEAPRGAAKYVVPCGKNPRLHTIEMSCPGG